ncbi:family 43 glycosylhydrolase [Longimicrobium terrae]|uniref:Cytochrome c551/c552 n=2 Tax=Longimicrobium terrae TaxID=1639882 RepID=A0A841GR07_9BACT|nr:RICIN domain-containing protein [Longimicrobium terrae]MBB6069510.1 cytochrome c551/c552 [Longimicrobium terrae]NNC31688.1 family 43 glycosylhydrolase [Longimicrobium terrae]
MRLRTLLVPLALAGLPACTEVSGPAAAITPDDGPPARSVAVSYRNPVLGPDAPDPHAAFLDGKYWIYPTSEGGQRFHAYSSTDMVNWVDEGVVLDLGPGVAWTDWNGWAPAIAVRNGKYYFYYSANGPHPDSKIGVAVGTSPRGPFTDIGRPLVTSDASVPLEAIDPMVFVDTDGQAYLYYGGSAGNGNMAIHRLNADMISLSGARIVQKPRYFTEGPFVHKRNGVYYLTYSNGGWNTPDYNVRYATSTSPLGPWTYGAQILGKDFNFSGPGHHAILQRPGADDWYIVYHRYEDGAEFNAKRRATAIDRLTYSGTAIQPVTMTGAVPNGRYKLFARHSGKALDVGGCSTADGADVITWPYSGLACQQWDLTRQTDGHYRITAAHSGKALDVGGCSTAEGANVITWPWSGIDCQRWQVVKTGPDAFKLVARNSGRVLDVAGCSTADGADVIVRAYTGALCQQWNIRQAAAVVPNGRYKLTARHSGQALDVADCSTADGADAITWPYWAGACQQWNLERLADGYYKITASHSGKALDVGGCSTADGADVITWPYSGAACQQWDVVDVGGDYYRVTARNSGMALDVAGCSTAGAADVIVRPYTGAACQQWRIETTP